MFNKAVHFSLMLLLHAGLSKGERQLQFLAESFLPSLQGADPEFDINGPRAPTPRRTGPALTVNTQFDGNGIRFKLGPFGMPSESEPSISKDIVGLFDEPKFVEAVEQEDGPQEHGDCLGYLTDNETLKMDRQIGKGQEDSIL